MIKLIGCVIAGAMSWFLLYGLFFLIVASITKDEIKSDNLAWKLALVTFMGIALLLLL